ncbi:di-trans,poly-cis-decaprenylcistransferase [Candidatus Woesearchaeota archaeon]|nr:di-trans,poly-cis-decaprenylcistransferase [Candidatus Woesearchaeota archaeon]
MRIPKHVAIIMDGNRRFAKRLMLEPWKGHEIAAEDNLERLCDWCEEAGVNELTLYAFSTENFNRPKREFDFLMKLFKKIFRELLEDPKVMERGLCVRFIGRLQMFDDEIQELVKKVMDRTCDNSDFFLNIAIGYGGRHEIVDGVRKVIGLAKKGMIDEDDIDENTFKNYLYNGSEPDLIIRTGGEKRLSNFLMWQSAYSELIFLDKMFPEFNKEDFDWCIKEYGERERRFGK